MEETSGFGDYTPESMRMDVARAAATRLNLSAHGRQRSRRVPLGKHRGAIRTSSHPINRAREERKRRVVYTHAMRQMGWRYRSEPWPRREVEQMLHETRRPRGQ